MNTSEFEVELENSEVPDHFYGKFSTIDGRELHFTFIIDPEDKKLTPRIIWHAEKAEINRLGISQQEAEYIILKEMNYQ